MDDYYKIFVFITREFKLMMSLHVFFDKRQSLNMVRIPIFLMMHKKLS